jgi:hypothetical protein
MDEFKRLALRLRELPLRLKVLHLDRSEFISPLTWVSDVPDKIVKLANRSFATPCRKLNDLRYNIAFKLQLEGLNVSAKQHLVGHEVDNMANA